MKADFLDGYAVGFRMAVGECFRDALSRERFSVGDTIYDTPLAYADTWAEALPHIGYCFQVIATISDHVEFEVLRPTLDRTKLAVTERLRESTTEFIERLRRGDPQGRTSGCSKPAVSA